MRTGPDGCSTTPPGSSAPSRDDRDRLLDASQTLLAVCDPDGTIRMANAASLRLAGRAPGDLCGRPLHSLVDPDDRETARLHWQRLDQDGWTSFEARASSPATGRWLLWRCTARDGAVYASAIDITDRKRFEQELWEAHAENERLLTAITSILIRTDEAGRITRWNAAAAAAFGRDRASVVGEPLASAVAWADRRLPDLLRDGTREPVRLAELRLTGDGGTDRFVTLTVTPLRRGPFTPDGFLVLGADVTERRLLEAQLRQAQKLEAIGQLASGIAHEINTPTQYVGDNTRFLRDAFGDLLPLLDGLCELARSTGERLPVADLVDRLAREARLVDLEFIRREVPLALGQSLEGIGRVTRIVRAMNEFSHPSEDARIDVDLNRAVETTVIVAQNEVKYVADVSTDLDPALPPVPCLPGEINQVILNLLVNAGHAIEDRAGGPPVDKGLITVTTRRDGEWAELRVADTGCGIPDALQPRVFEPFFTTKDVGRGTGQGLAIAHAVVVKKHGGDIRFETAAGEGTTFIVRLPLKPGTGAGTGIVRG